jgi:hypothetical protein
MRLLPSVRREVSPLSPPIEALLRGTPRVDAPDDLRVSLLAAYERRASHGSATRSPASLWSRLAIPLTATASAAAVLLAGVALRAPDAGAGEWVQMHPATHAASPPVRVVDVNDPALDALGSPGTLLAAAPIEGP